MELSCYKALIKIKAIVKDDLLTDSECFQQIEKSAHTFEELGSAGDTQHDFGGLHRRVIAR